MPGPPVKTVLVAAVALINDAGEVLLAQRPQGRALAGLWEFPGGKACFMFLHLSCWEMCGDKCAVQRADRPQIMTCGGPLANGCVST